jgi:hypothetical protein
MRLCLQLPALLRVLGLEWCFGQQDCKEAGQKQTRSSSIMSNISCASSVMLEKTCGMVDTY